MWSKAGGHHDSEIFGLINLLHFLAQAGSKKLIFSHQEFAGSAAEDRKQFELMRKDLQEAAEFFAQKEQFQVVEADSTRPSGPAISGMRTVKGFSEDEKYRITYEARQKIRWLRKSVLEKSDSRALVQSEPSDETISEDDEYVPVGSVEPGALIFPGAHASLQNISADHRFIKTESFEVGGVTVEHKAGSKTRLLFQLVELRKKKPSLFEKVEIYQQPSSNCDSVILKWMVSEQGRQDPYSVWNRDSFAATFSDSVIQAQKVCSQFSCIILGKVTAKIQLTDTDFAASFKAGFVPTRFFYRTSRSGGVEFSTVGHIIPSAT